MRDRKRAYYQSKDFHAISPLIDALTPEELLEVVSPRQMILALRVAEEEGLCTRVLLRDADGKIRTQG